MTCHCCDTIYTAPSIQRHPYSAIHTAPRNNFDRHLSTLSVTRVINWNGTAYNSHTRYSLISWSLLIQCKYSVIGFRSIQRRPYGAVHTAPSIRRRPYGAVHTAPSIQRYPYSTTTFYSYTPYRQIVGDLSILLSTIFLVQKFTHAEHRWWKMSSAHNRILIVSRSM